MIETIDNIAIVLTLIAMVVVTGWVFFYYISSMVLGVIDVVRGGSGDLKVASTAKVAADSTTAN